MESPLVFDTVDYHYGRHCAVAGVTARLSGGITGLLGRNGAGKTTLMRLAMGLLVPSGGQVRLLGADPARQPSCRLRAGYLPQSFEPPRNMRVRAYVETLALLSGVPQRRVRAAVEDALAQVGLLDKASSRLGALSGGMLRRVGVAQAIVHSPDVLIVDEPAAGLDPEERVRLYHTLRQLSARCPVLVSTHHVDELEREADHLWMLRRGKLTWQGSIPEALRSVAGLVREGVLAEGERPAGRAISERPTAAGIRWRTLGDDPRLLPAEPTLLDAYIHHAGQEG